MTSRPLTRGRALRRAIGALWGTVCVLLIAVVIALAVAWKAFGLVPVAVQTGSMRPTLPVHSLIFDQTVPDDQIRVGDIITFTPDDGRPRTTHRVVKIDHVGGATYFRTKGDANRDEDDWAPTSTGRAGAASYLRGVTYPTHHAVRVVGHVPLLGWLAALMGHPKLRLALVLVPFTLMALQLIAGIWAPRPRLVDVDDDAEREGIPADADEPAAA